MLLRCAWCDKEMGEKDGQGVEGETHGICDDCLNRYFPTTADKAARLNITEQDRYPDYKVRDERRCFLQSDTTKEKQWLCSEEKQWLIKHLEDNIRNVEEDISLSNRYKDLAMARQILAKLK